MMRTIEVLIVVVIIAGAFIAASAYAVLPWPREVSPVNLRRLSYTTLQTLDSNYDLSQAAFAVNDNESWINLQTTLSASLPPNVLYNLTVYDVGNSSTTQLYTPLKTISNTPELGSTSDAFSYTVASSSVTFNMVPEKIGENGGGTLYILNCNDANGWWITGYTAQGLAEDLYKMLSPYFSTTVLVNSTVQLRELLDGQTISALPNESVLNAVIINTFGETVPMPQEYAQGGSRADLGYDPSHGYAKYCWTIGNTCRIYNWTWSSIVGYPFYYVSNTATFSSQENSWGIYGMRQVGQSGIRAFLEGLDNQAYSSNDASVISNVGISTLTQTAIDASNYYGIYPYTSQTSTRAITTSILDTYHLSIGVRVFNQIGEYNPGAMYNHRASGSTDVTGSLLALGLTRTPDVRLASLSLLSFYHPQLYRSEYTAYGTSRLVILQLGLIGGV
ncbi:MAG: hypothetical protein ACFCUE_05720 [Candidatus Bathyarchaeia archaeon]|jgi:hypothetical protein